MANRGGGDDPIAWAFAHPWALLVAAVVVVIGLAIWLAQPVTWRDGEGRINVGDEEWTPRSAGFLTALLRGLRFWF